MGAAATLDPAHQAMVLDAGSADSDRARAARLAQLRGKLNAREGKPGFKHNCRAIRFEMTRLQEA